ncbi:YceD family protein [Weissella viridescens]
MKWHFAELQNYKNEPLMVDETLDLKGPMLEKFSDVILDIEPIHVIGYIQADRDDLLIHLHLATTIVTPSSRSLTPVEFPLETDMDEIYIQEAAHADRYEDDETIILVEHDLIDFDEAIMESIVVSVPMQVLSETEKETDEMPSGKDWEVISEDAYAARKAEDPEAKHTPLAGLADLLNDDE